MQQHDPGTSDGGAQGLFAGALITSVVGAVVTLASDFGGWEYDVLYYDSTYLDRYGALGLTSGLQGALLTAAIVAPLGYAAYASYRGVRPGASHPDRAAIRPAFYAAIAALAVAIVGAVLFAVAMAFEETEEWWLDAGFYGGVLGGGLTALFLRLAVRQAGASGGNGEP